MVISSYHVINVLRVYGDQLRQRRNSDGSNNSEKGSHDRISFSDMAKRRVIVNKIATDIVQKITNFSPEENIEQELPKNLEKEYGVRVDFTRQGPNDLLFKIIDENGETLNSLSIENSEFLRYKLEEIDKETTEKSQKSESED